nr:hypothetical protein [Angustibacter aerolatus]
MLAESGFALAPYGEPAGRRVRAVHRADPDERRRPAGRARGAQGGGGLGARLGRLPGRRGGAGRHRPHRVVRRHPAGGRRAARGGGQGARRRASQGRREAGHARALRRACGPWASAR